MKTTKIVLEFKAMTYMYYIFIFFYIKKKSRKLDRIAS